jgi:hypothetical protein
LWIAILPLPHCLESGPIKALSQNRNAVKASPRDAEIGDPERRKEKEQTNTLGKKKTTLPTTEENKSTLPLL